MTFDPQTEFLRVQLSAANPFREQVTYTPTGGEAKSIYAVVGRGGIKSLKSKTDRMPSIYDYEILISTDETSGVLLVTPRKDKVALAMHEIGGSNTFTVAGIISRTPGAWHLGLMA